MKTVWRLVLLLTQVVLASAWAQGPEVSGVTVRQRPADPRWFDIRYNLAHPSGVPCRVWVQVSTDGGVSFPASASTMTGAVGNGVEPGVDKLIEWNAYQDFPDLDVPRAVVRVLADDGRLIDGLYDDFDTAQLDSRLWSVPAGQSALSSAGGNLELNVAGTTLRLSSAFSGYRCLEMTVSASATLGPASLLLSCSWFQSQALSRAAVIGLWLEAGAFYLRAGVCDQASGEVLWNRDLEVASVAGAVRLRLGYASDLRRLEFWHENTLFASYPVPETSTAPGAAEFGRFAIEARSAGPGTTPFRVHSVSAWTAFSAQTSTPALLYVDTAASSAPYTGTAEHPLRSLQTALTLAWSGATVQMRAGTYSAGGALDRDRGWQELQDVTILGTLGDGGSLQTRLQGAGTGAGFTVRGIGNVRLRNLDVAGFETGIRFSGNTEGGVVEDCTIRNHTSSGVVLPPTGLRLTGCMVSGNGGRGVWVDGAGPAAAATVVERCRIQANRGCGLYATGALGQVLDSFITGNQAGLGDAAAGVCFGGGGTLLNVTIAGNLGGPGVAVTGAGPVDLRNSIIAGNGGIGLDTSGLTGPFLIDYNDVWGNTGSPYSAGLVPGSSSISEDPLFAAAADYHLTRNSPCIGAGDNAAAGEARRDIDGEDRVQRVVVDMGADETGLDFLRLKPLGRRDGACSVVAASGRYASVANRRDSPPAVGILDVADPALPVAVGTVSNLFALDMMRFGSYLLVTPGTTGGLSVVDVSEPGTPGAPIACDWDIGLGTGRGVAVTGDKALVCTTTGSLCVVDLNTPMAPRLLGGSTVQAGAATVGVVVSGAYAYLLALNSTNVGVLQVIDLSDTAALRTVSTFDGLVSPQAVAASAGNAYVADGTGGLQVIRVQPVTQPASRVGVLGTTGQAIGVAAVVEPYLLLAERQGPAASDRVMVIDVSNPVSPVATSTVTINGQIAAIRREADRLYVATDSGLSILQISSSLAVAGNR